MKEITAVANGQEAQIKEITAVAKMLAEKSSGGSGAASALPSASKPKLLSSCREYKEANPDAKDGTYVLAAQTHFMDNNGRGNLEYAKRNKATTRPEMKVYCDMEADGGGWTLVGRKSEGYQIPYDVRVPTSSGNYQNLVSSVKYDPNNFGTRERFLLDPYGSMPDATGSALLSDEVIMDIKTRYNQGSDVGYRTTSPKCGDSCTYFHHEDCRFCAAAAGAKTYQSGGAHRDCAQDFTSARHPCRRYKKTLA